MNRKTTTTWGALALCFLATSQACSTDSASNPKKSPAEGMGGENTGDGDTVGGTGGTTSPSTGGSSTATGGTSSVLPCDADDAEVRSLPYNIENDFYYINEIPEDVTSARVVAGASCGEESGAGGAGGAGGASGTEGSCYVFDYVPDYDEDPETAPSWGGIIVQSNEMPDGQGTTGAGICIEPGATTITFEAKADNEITDVKFGAIRPGPGATEHWVRISSTWAEYTVTIPLGETYNNHTETGGVWNGLSAVLEPLNQEAEPLPPVTRISVRNVVWD